LPKNIEINMRLNLMDDKIVGIMKIMHTQSTHNIYLKSTVEIASAPIRKVRLPGVVNIRTVEDVQYSKTRRKWKHMRTNKTVA
jgi:ribosomal protein L39E